MENNITYGLAVPLIGGLGFGMEMACGGNILPEFVISYDAFKSNDQHYISHLEKKGWRGKYYLDLDEAQKDGIYADVVGAVCPCAGLSSYSTTSSASSATNQWMYNTAEYVCGTIKPKVFWGENAPRLSQDSGKDVANRLYEIAKKHGYSFQLYYTESRLHGLPQIRPRTFYFFTRSEKCPIFPWWNRERYEISKILQQDIHKDDPMNIQCKDNANPYENPWILYYLHAYGATRLIELCDHIEKTKGLCSTPPGHSFLDMAQWFAEHGFDAEAKRARNIQENINNNRGYWGHSVTFPVGDSMPALIGNILYDLINPYREEFLRIRDCLRLMGMPEDFNLHGENPRKYINHIAQNVPVTTAADMMTGIIAYLHGKTDFAESSYIKQNNKNKTIENRESENSNSLLEFL